MEATNNFNVVLTRQESFPIPLTESDVHTTSQRNDTKLVGIHTDSAVSSVTAESCTQTKEILDARRDTTMPGTLAASSERSSREAEEIQISMDVEETRASLKETL